MKPTTVIEYWMHDELTDQESAATRWTELRPVHHDHRLPIVEACWTHASPVLLVHFLPPTQRSVTILQLLDELTIEL